MKNLNVLALAVSMAVILPSVSAADYESSVSLSLDSVIDTSILNQELYQVDPDVLNDGFMNNYRVSSDFGEFNISSTSLLKIRLTEIEAMAKMREVEEDDSTEQAMQDDVDEVQEGLSALVEDPEAALKGAASGVSKMFKLGGEAWKSRHTRDENSAEAIGKTLSGYNSAWRDYAGQFQVDPYSSNEALQVELDRLATAAAKGSVIGSAAKMLIPGGLGFAVSATAMSQQLNELLITSSEVELRIINRDKLIAMGVDPILTEQFLDDPSSSPTYKTYTVGALETMEETMGKDYFVAYSKGAESEDIALFRAFSAIGYAWYHKEMTAIKTFEAAGSFVTARDADDNLIVVAPVDHLLWTEALDQVIAQIDSASAEQGGHKGKKLLLSGTISDAARQNLESRDWDVTDQMRMGDK